MRRQLIWIVVLCGLTDHRVIAQATTARIILAPETETGRVPNTLRIRLIDVSSKKDFGPSFRGLIAKDVPFGYYDLTVSTPAYKNYERKIAVFEPEITLRVMLQFSVEATGVERIEGIVTPSPDANAKHWILLFPLVGSPGEILEAPIQTDGRFSFLSSFGSYLLAVVKGDEVLSSRKIQVVHDTPPLRITPNGDANRNP
jgi:hypothetical protein